MSPLYETPSQRSQGRYPAQRTYRAATVHSTQKKLLLQFRPRRKLVFSTNNLTWAPSSIATLYKSRWSIKTLFNQLKQTLQLCGFLVHSKKRHAMADLDSATGICSYLRIGNRTPRPTINQREFAMLLRGSYNNTLKEKQVVHNKHATVP